MSTSIRNVQITSVPSTGDYRLSAESAAANAPELDYALVAPEYREGDGSLEVAPGTEKQTYYKNEPPEVATVEPSGSISNLSSNGTVKVPVPHKKRLIEITILTILITIALGIGLGVGLRPPQNGDASNGPDPFATTSTGRAVHRFIRDNSTIAAVTLPDGRRQVYFQDSAGEIRQGRNLHRKRWQPLMRDVLDTDRIVSDAKNNTPLAAVTMFSDHPSRVTLFYVSENNILSCVHQEVSKFCDVLDDFPNHIVAPDSHQISVIVPSNTPNITNILITYRSSARGIAIMHGFKDETTSPTWNWTNETSKFDSALQTYSPQILTRHVAATCSAFWDVESSENPFLFCFVKNDYISDSSHDGRITQFRFAGDRTAQGNITVKEVVMDDRKDAKVRDSSDIAVLSLDQNGRGRTFWMNRSTLQQSNGGTLPLPNTKFPFDRLASTPARDSTESYLYHQISDTVIEELLWNARGGFWESQNITIDTA